MDDSNVGVIDDPELLIDFDIDFDFWMSECCLNHAAEDTNTQFDLDIPRPQPGEAANDALEMRGFDVNVEPQHDENGGGWVRRRRLKKGTSEYMQRKQEIRLQNRISARKSIQKKAAYIRELEGKFNVLEAENRIRKRVLQIFPDARPAGRLCGLRRAFSTSDFYLPREATNENI